MINIALDNHIFQDFFLNECKKDEKTFLEKIKFFIEKYRNEEDVKSSFSELKDFKNGKIKSKNIQKLLSELKND